MLKTSLQQILRLTDQSLLLKGRKTFLDLVLYFNKTIIIVYNYLFVLFANIFPFHFYDKKLSFSHSFVSLANLLLKLFLYLFILTTSFAYKEAYLFHSEPVVNVCLYVRED